MPPQRPHLTLFLDVVSPFAYMAFYMVRVCRFVCLSVYLSGFWGLGWRIGGRWGGGGEEVRPRRSKRLESVEE